MHRDPEGKEIEVITGLLGPSTGDLLEIGCGDGRLTKELDDLFGTLTALDPELPTVVEAAASYAGRTRFLAGSGEELPLADGCADVVLFSLSLHHQDSVKALEEARRVLRDDGRVLVLEPVEHSMLVRLFAFIDDESAEYERAEMAIAGSGLKEIQSGSYKTRWVFEDFEEMTNCLFDHFDLEPDTEKVREMAQLLGEGRMEQPLAIEDITRYWLLCEGASPEAPHDG
jgi:ubiquinone/menaquinone biosynthesis C-methylase UbiE